MVLKTLGRLSLEGSDFQRPKALLLLAYLVLEGQKERRHLAELFWPHHDNALGNLAMTLSRLKKVIQPLEINEVFVRATLASDFDDLHKAVERKEWGAVTALYRGAFLDGIDISHNGIEVEEWICEKREHFAYLARHAMLCFAEDKARQQDFGLAAQETAKAYHLHYAPEPDIDDLKRVYLLLQADRHPSARDVQKEAAAYDLKLTLTPAEAKVHLLELQHQPTITLPVFSTAFIGRKIELKHIGAELVKPEVRLLTLVAQGGMGKTRLAVEVARSLQSHFADKVCFVSFVSVSSPEQIPYVLGGALKYSFLGAESPQVQILRFLKDKELLLIMDNLEHLLESTPFILDILQDAPKIKILVTSRESLNLQAEHLIEVKGLSFSTSDSDAVKVFLQAAQSRQADFALGEGTLTDTLRLCHLVEGMPLALELAASWLRTLSLRHIVNELEQGLDVLQSSARDLPQRHKSIRAVFDYSWQLLSQEEQTIMARLSVFQGGFALEAAKEVTGTSLAVLASLIDKSFLSIEKERYQRLPLVIQYTQEKLEQRIEEKSVTEEKHGRYFLKLIGSIALKLRSLERKVILDRLEPDFANITAAWLWAVKTKNIDVLNDSVEPLGEMLSNNHREAVELINQAISTLDENNPEHYLSLSKLYLEQVKHLMWLGISTESSIKKGLEFAKLADYKRGIVKGVLFTTNGMDAFSLEDPRISPYGEGFKFARQHGSPIDIADYYCCEIQYKRIFSTPEEVEVYFVRAATELKELGDYVMLVEVQLIYGAFLVYQKRFEEGRRLLLEALRLNHQLDKKIMYSVLYVELGYAAYKLKNFQEAISFFNDAKELAVQTGWLSNRTKALGYLTRIAVAQHNQKRAYRYLQELDLMVHPQL